MEELKLFNVLIDLLQVMELKEIQLNDVLLLV